MEVNRYQVKCNYSSIAGKQYLVNAKIACKEAWRLRLVNDRLHVTCEKELNVYNMEGDLVESIQYKHCNDPDVTSGLPLGNNEYIIADNKQGLYLINDNGEVVTKLCNGSFCDIFHYKDKIYALEYKTVNINVFEYVNQCITNLHQI
jgi:hypothetical protein